MTSKTNKEKDPPPSFWQEFEWTEKEKDDVIQLLQKHQEKCDIIENAVTPQRGQYIIDKYDKDAHKYWNNFYSSHETKFFKDRHYLNKAFPDEFGVVYANHGDQKGEEEKDKGGSINVDDDKMTKKVIDSDENFTITEIGCGVGNTVLPLLELDPFVITPVSKHNDDDGGGDDGDGNGNNVKNIEKDNQEILLYQKRKLVVWGLDFSSVAIKFLKQDMRYINATTVGNERARAQVWDITSTHPRDIITTAIQSSTSSCGILEANDKNEDDHNNESQLKQKQYCLESSSNISLLLFVLSAISPDKMAQAAKNVAASLKPGGILLLRDYGRYDQAQIKLGMSRNKRLSDNFYVKHDGTRCYYFTLEDMKRLFGMGDKNCNKDDNTNTANNDEEEGAGLEVLDLKYVQRIYKNRADDETRRRVWVQARFRKPL